MHRPHYTHKDANHNVVIDFMRYACGGFEIAPADVRNKTLAYTANYQGHKFIAHDCANIGGVFADWLLECMDTRRMCWIEIKTEAAYQAKDHSLKAGEMWLLENSNLFVFAMNDEDVKTIFEAMIAPDETNGRITKW